MNHDDDNYSRELFQTRIDSCKIAKGVQASMYTRTIFEHFKGAANFNVTCPFKKNVTLSVTNLKISDNYFPPLSYEQKVRFFYQSFANIKEQKGWINMYNVTITLRYKK